MKRTIKTEDFRIRSFAMECATKVQRTECSIRVPEIKVVSAPISGIMGLSNVIKIGVFDGKIESVFKKGFLSPQLRRVRIWGAALDDVCCVQRIDTEDFIKIITTYGSVLVSKKTRGTITEIKTRSSPVTQFEASVHKGLEDTRLKVISQAMGGKKEIPYLKIAGENICLLMNSLLKEGTLAATIALSLKEIFMAEGAGNIAFIRPIIM